MQNNRGRGPLPYSNKTVALTGGAGKVGRLLRNVLKDQVEALIILDIVEPDELFANERWEACDICDPVALERSLTGVDAIVHLAGYPNERSIEDVLRLNVLGTHNVYETARRLKISRVVLGSSNHVTGFYPVNETVNAENSMRPDSYYGLSKCWNELEASLYFEKFGIETLAIRIGNATTPPSSERSDGRSDAIWVSPRDLAQLVLIGLEDERITCTTVYGISNTSHYWWDNSVALSLGYRPQDGQPLSEEGSYRSATALPETIGNRFQGGRFCTRDHDGVLRDRKISFLADGSQ